MKNTTMILSTLALASMVATSNAALVKVHIGAGGPVNAGGLANVVDGDQLNFGQSLGTAGALALSGTGSSSREFTVNDGAGNFATLRINLAVVGNVSPNKNMGGIGENESVTISFDLVSGTLNSFTISNYGVRNVTAGEDGGGTIADGYAGAGFSFSDGTTTNTFYGLRAVNPTIGSGGSTYLTTDPTYADGVFNPVSQFTTAGLENVTKDNLNTWSFTMAGVDNANNGVMTAAAALNDLNLEIDVAAVPEPSSAALLGLAGFAFILRRRK